MMASEAPRSVMSRRARDSAQEFDFPSAPDFIPDWAIREGAEWAGLDEFSILVKAESRTGKVLELDYQDLPSGTWGVHVVRGRRGMIIVNNRLPLSWRRFALFHELYHLLEHNGGSDLWTRTATPMSSFERQADLFAWGVINQEWSRCWAHAST